MTEEFNLSEKIISNESDDPNVIGVAMGKDCALFVDDVKEFIKRREDVIQAFLRKEINCAKMWIELRELAGDKLK